MKMPPALGILGGVLVGSIIIATKGVNSTTYYYLLEGAFGSLENFTASLIKSIPLGFELGCGPFFAGIFIG